MVSRTKRKAKPQKAAATKPKARSGSAAKATKRPGRKKGPPKAEPKTMKELLEKTNYQIPVFSYGDIVEGEVVSTEGREVLINLGAKSEGVIAGRETRENPRLVKDLKVGDKILAFVLQAENDQGYIVLSLKRAYPERRWRELEKLFEKDEPLKVKVIEYNRGGLLVDAGFVTGFIPTSHLKRERLRQLLPSEEVSQRPQKLVGQELTVKIIEMARNQNRLVLSEKEALSSQDRERLEEALRSLKSGRVLDGIVTGVMPFGLFVELQGKGKKAEILKKIEGLVHVSEIAWEKVSRPRDFYKVGDKVKVKVVEVDPELFKIALSIKQTIDNPWHRAAEKYKVGAVVEGTVTKIVPFGAFVRLEEGLEGLIHVSETTGPLKAGEKIKALVLEVNPAEQKLALSLKKLAAQAPDNNSVKG